MKRRFTHIIIYVVFLFGFIGCNNLVNTTTYVTTDTVTTTLSEFTISFEENGGSEVTDIVALTGSTIIEPTSPIREGYTFSGWYIESTLQNEYTFTTMPSSSITLFAKWTANQYTISFETNGGSLIDPIVQDYDSIVLSPQNPVLMNYRFEGWYLDEQLTELYEFTTMPARDITLYAKFVYAIPEGLQYLIQTEEVIITGYTGVERNIILPETIDLIPVTTISGYAFQGSYVQSVQLHHNITTIEGYGFRSAIYLETITIPNSVTYIGLSAFENCYHLEEIIFEEEIQLSKIEDKTFGNCAALKSIAIPDSVVSIGIDAFYRNTKLKTVLLGNNLDIIKQGAFYGNTSLRFINLPEGLTRIDTYAFTSASNLSSIVIPSTVTYVGAYAFAGCSSLIIYTPLTSQGYWHPSWNASYRPVIWKIIYHGNNGELDYVIRSDNYITLLTQWPEFEGDTLVIPFYIGLYQVDSIAYKAFESNLQLTNVGIPTSVQTIGEHAFANSEINIYTPYSSEPPSWQTYNYNPDENTVYWGDASYYQTTVSFESNGGSAVEEITATEGTFLIEPDEPTKEGCTFIGWYADSALTDEYFFALVPHDDLTLYAKWLRNESTISFDSNGGLAVEAITEYEGDPVTPPDNPIWENLLFDGWYTEKECINLYTFTTMPADDITLYAKWSGMFTTTVDGMVFNGTPEGVTLIDYTGNILDVVIPEVVWGKIPVTRVGEDAFYNSSITSIIIPATVISIEEYAFGLCYNLTTVTFASESQLQTIGNYSFYYSLELLEINLPDTLTSIGQEAFINCSALKKVVLPVSLVNIGLDAFNNTSNLIIYCLFAEIPSTWNENWNPDNAPVIFNFDEIIDDGSFIYAATTDNYASILGLSETNSNSDIIIPQTLGGYTVISINRNAFKYNTSITSVTIPNTVKYIYVNAFIGASFLNTVIFQTGSQLELIGESAFSMCERLVVFEIPDGVLTIGEEAFYYTPKLESIVIPSSVEVIEEWAFFYCGVSVINVVSETIPVGWHIDWNPDLIPVVWGYTG